MPRFPHTRRAGRVAAAAALAAAVAALSACSPDEILDVDTPDIIDPRVIATPAGADALRLGALRQLAAATAGVDVADPNQSFSDSMYMLGGLLADEYRSGDTFVQRDETDRRTVQTANANVDAAYRFLHRARTGGHLAAAALRAHSPDAPAWQLAQALFVEGFAETVLAEHFCSGVPTTDVALDGAITYGPPLTTAALLERAAAHFGEALAAVGDEAGPEADRVRNAARVANGRALLGLARFADAAAAVAAVPTAAAYRVEFNESIINNTAWEYNNNERRYTVADRDGGVGLDFATANDPRLPVCRGGDARCRAAGVSNPRVFDSAIASTLPLYVQLKWPTRTSPAAIADGVEARLIEAEAALRAGDAAGALATLNALRAVVPGLAPLDDAGAEAARVDQLFRERAFWLFGTGHRLGDLRRLVRQYGRAPEAVFPTGAFIKGGTYGSDVNFPVSQAEENHPNFTACIDRSA